MRKDYKNINYIILCHILVAWQGHRGDQNNKKNLSKTHPKATKLKAVARTLIDEK